MDFSLGTLALLVIFESTIFWYLSQYRRADALPNSRGWTQMSMIMKLLISIIFVWQLGWIWGLLAGFLVISSVPVFSLGWIAMVPWIVRNKKGETPPFRNGVFGIYTLLFLVLLTISVAQLFVYPFESGFRYLSEKPVLYFSIFGLVVVGYLTNISVDKVLNKLLRSDQSEESKGKA